MTVIEKPNPVSVNELAAGDLKFKGASLVELLQWRASIQPHAPAYIFLGDTNQEEGVLTYAQLDRQARALAGLLNSFGVGRERVLLVYPQGLDYIAAFFGCLYNGSIAIPIPPPHPVQLKRTLPRFQAVVNDAEPVVALTVSRIQSKIGKIFEEAPELTRMRWLATDEIDKNSIAQWKPPVIGSDTLAYLQYTSGSTATPKGVMVTHGGVLYNVGGLDRAFRHMPGSKLVSWLPHFHDLGLVYGIIQPMFNGIPCYLMSPAAFVQKPIQWLQTITKYKATHSAAPNFAYQLCVGRLRPEHHSTLDLSSLRVALTGAEPIRKETHKKFADAFAPFGFRWDAFCPAYGLAEATLAVSVTHRDDPPIFCTVSAADLEQNRIVEISEGEAEGRVIAGCGRALSGTRVAIVHPETRIECQSGEVGEVWVSGTTVARGYWNRDEESEQTFLARLADTDEGPFLRTGDLGFFKDGELLITGRLKDLLIIAGRNHYPQDIEATMEISHPTLRPGCCAAFSIEIDGEERLVVVGEIERRYSRARHSPGRTKEKNPPPDDPERQPLDAEAVVDREAAPGLDQESVIRAIREAISESHDVAIYKVVLLKTGGLPKTSSGKIQRRACRADFLAGTMPVWEG